MFGAISMKRKVIIHLVRKKNCLKNQYSFLGYVHERMRIWGLEISFFSRNYEYVRDIQLIFTYPKSMIEILEKGVKCVQCER